VNNQLWIIDRFPSDATDTVYITKQAQTAVHPSAERSAGGKDIVFS
jgi:hypothetical protein